MCDRTSRFWIYTTVISLLWGHFGIWTSPAGTRFYCWILPMFTPFIITRIFSAQHPFISICWPCFQMEDFFRLSFIVNFEFLTHLFLMLLDDAILFKLLNNFIFTRYILYIRVFVHFEISKKVCLQSVISLILKLPFTRLILRYICTAF